MATKLAVPLSRTVCYVENEAAACAILVCLLATGCIFLEVRDDQRRTAALAELSGSVRTRDPSDHVLVVVLLRREPTAAEKSTGTRLAVDAVREQIRAYRAGERGRATPSGRHGIDDSG